MREAIRYIKQLSQLLEGDQSNSEDAQQQAVVLKSKTEQPSLIIPNSDGMFYITLGPRLELIRSRLFFMGLKFSKSKNLGNRTLVLNQLCVRSYFLLASKTKTEFASGLAHRATAEEVLSSRTESGSCL